MYDCKYEISWLKIIKPLSLVCINDIRPSMMVRESFMWNLENSGKVMNVEVERHNGILQVKEW